MSDQIKCYETTSGKVIRVKPVKGGYGLWGIDFASGGVMPPEFKQSFTSFKLACTTVEKYLKKKKHNMDNVVQYTVDIYEQQPKASA